MRRLFCLVISAVALLVGTFSQPVYAVLEELPDMTALEAAANVEEGLPAKSAILLEQSSGRILFEKDPDIQLPPASITKIMVLLLAMEALDQNRISLEDDVICSPYASSMGGSQIWLEAGESMKMEDILKAVAISSANDAAVALAEHLAGSEGAFVQQMNEKAQALGMTNTVFQNATGLDAPGHLSTARDIALMSRELLTYPQIMEYTKVWMSALRDGKTQLVNTNKLVRFYEGCTGLKTGTTNDAGSCLAASATRKGLSLIAVTLGSATSEERFSSARGLLDYGFANYLRLPVPALEEILPVKIRKGVERAVEVLPIPPESIVVKSGEKTLVRQEISLPESVEAPIFAGQPLGEATIFVGDDILLTYPLVAPKDIPKMTYPKAFSLLLDELFSF